MLPIMFFLILDDKDQEFVATIYEHFHRLMYKIAGEYASSPEEKEEIFQLALLRLVKSTVALKKLNESKLSSYIAKLTKNTALNHIKHKNVILKHSAPVEDEEVFSDRLSMSPEDIILRQERWDMLMDAIGRLSEADQLVIEGKLMLHMSDDEMAAVLGCKPRSVSMKLTRAKRRARQEILRIEEDD